VRANPQGIWFSAGGTPAHALGPSNQPHKERALCHFVSVGRGQSFCSPGSQAASQLGRGITPASDGFEKTRLIGRDTLGKSPPPDRRVSTDIASRSRFLGGGPTPSLGLGPGDPATGPPAQKAIEKNFFLPCPSEKRSVKKKKTGVLRPPKHPHQEQKLGDNHPKTRAPICPHQKHQSAPKKVRLFFSRFSPVLPQLSQPSRFAPALPVGIPGRQCRKNPRRLGLPGKKVESGKKCGKKRTPRLQKIPHPGGDTRSSLVFGSS